MQGEDPLRELEELEREARKIRRRMADWNMIRRLPGHLRRALEFYIETGDIREAARMAGLDLEAFRELLRLARVPVVT